MKRIVLSLAATCFFFSCLTCAGPSYEDVLIKDVPHVKQKPDFCGEACAEMFLRKLGRKLDQDYVFNQSGVDPVQGRGCYAKELAPALEKVGFKIGPVWYSVAANSDPEIESQWKALHADLLHGISSIVCMHSSSSPQATEHFRLILGYDAKADEVLYHEPAEANGAYRRMSRKSFLTLWPLHYDAKSWLVIRMRLEPGQIRDATPAAGFTSADYAQHIMRLKRMLPAPTASVSPPPRTDLPDPGWTILVQAPFVVIGDESPSAVKQHAERTIKWAVDKLKQDYFKKDPWEILDIWLFKDDTSYTRNTKAIFGEKPWTPFGWFSPKHNALIMNIGTGGGTLVHEIVHPFIRSNFPRCPSWFNEGLGSLYEQCGEEDGHIHGYTNWRLAGLQKAIKAGTVPSFKTLTATSEGEFYNEDKGSNYAQSRYFCYYLQEKGLLTKFYHAFVAAQSDDPTGYKTLQSVLGEKDMDAFKKKWEAFVLKLEFRD